MTKRVARFQELIRQVQQGSHQAAQLLAELYGPHVQRYVRRAITREMRNQYDSLDFVQLVWTSFFTQAEELPVIESPAQLVGYLAKMAQYKVMDEERRLHTQKHDVRREDRLGAPAHSITSRDPTPSAVAIFREEWENLVDRQPQEIGQVVKLRYEGATYQEIAEELNIHERTARKTIDRLERSRQREEMEAEERT